MAKYAGISTVEMQNGTTSIHVRFKHQGKNYGVKNFTKHFGCISEKQAFNKLQEVRYLLSQNINPFNKKSLMINDIWDKYVLSKEWAFHTKKNYMWYYKSVIRNSIGKKQITQITYNDIMKIKNSLSTKSISYQNKLKVILNPIFNDALLNGQIKSNPFQLIKNKTANISTPISSRVLENEEDILKKIYTILIDKNLEIFKKDKEETRIFFLLLVLSAHRFGELLELKKENIYENKIVSPSSITKTKRPYEFPLPNECQEYIQNINEGKLFPNLTRGKISTRFKVLIEYSQLTTINHANLTPHDTRRLFMSICIQNNLNESLVDYCLEHIQRGVKASYLHFNYQQKIIVFNKYWEIIKT